MPKSRVQVALDGLIIILAICFFAFLDQRALSARKLPRKEAGQSTVPAHLVDTQQDVYDAYQKMGLFGARVVHLNRFFNLQEYVPRELTRPDPFPLPAVDQGRIYERGLDSHNWLYIATRTGLVRSIITVLPDSVFRLRYNDLRDNPDYSHRQNLFKGYAYDAPRSITTLDALHRTEGPVVVNVDAGYFIDGSDPAWVLSKLGKACPDIRGVVLVRSIDEPDVDRKMREKLDTFGELWKGRK